MNGAPAGELGPIPGGSPSATLSIDAFGHRGETTRDTTDCEDDLYSVARSLSDFLGWADPPSRSLWGVEEARLPGGSEGDHLAGLQVGLSPGAPLVPALPSAVECFLLSAGRFGSMTLRELRVSVIDGRVTPGDLDPIMSGRNWFNARAFDESGMEVHMALNADRELDADAATANLQSLDARPFIVTSVAPAGTPSGSDDASGGLEISAVVPEATSLAVAWLLSFINVTALGTAPAVRRVTTRVEFPAGPARGVNLR